MALSRGVSNNPVCGVAAIGGEATRGKLGNSTFITEGVVASRGEATRGKLGNSTFITAGVVAIGGEAIRGKLGNSTFIMVRQHRTMWWSCMADVLGSSMCLYKYLEFIPSNV
jgi:hypothetical protein